MKYLIFGNGWIGNRLRTLLPNALVVSDRINIPETIVKSLTKHRPDFVINAVGKTGRPNIDWCESHPQDTIHSNVSVPAWMAQACESIPLIHIGSGCIYEGDKLYRETDAPNYHGSLYSRTKIMAEDYLKSYKNTLILRIRMPMDTIPNDRNLINKLVGYGKVIDTIPNSVTFLSTLAQAIEFLADNKKSGIYHVVDGELTHKEILDSYRRYVIPNHTWKSITLEELASLTTTGRSNCTISNLKLKDEGFPMLDVHQTLDETMQKYADNYVMEDSP